MDKKRGLFPGPRKSNCQRKSGAKVFEKKGQPTHSHSKGGNYNNKYRDIILLPSSDLILEIIIDQTQPETIKQNVQSPKPGSQGAEQSVEGQRVA